MVHWFYGSVLRVAGYDVDFGCLWRRGAAEAVKPFPNPRDHHWAEQVEGIDVVQDADSVTYVHFLFDRHQIVESEGAETEAVFTAPEPLITIDSEARVEICTCSQSWRA